MGEADRLREALVALAPFAGFQDRPDWPADARVRLSATKAEMEAPFIIGSITLGDFRRARIAAEALATSDPHSVKPDEVERLARQLGDLKFGLEELSRFVVKKGGEFHEDWEKTSEFLEFGAARIDDAIAALRTPVLSDDPAKVREEQRGEVERLREALETAAWNMQTMASDIKNPGQRALADRWIAQTRAAALRRDADGGRG